MTYEIFAQPRLNHNLEISSYPIIQHSSYPVIQNKLEPTRHSSKSQTKNIWPISNPENMHAPRHSSKSQTETIYIWHISNLKYTQKFKIRNKAKTTHPRNIYSNIFTQPRPKQNIGFAETISDQTIKMALTEDVWNTKKYRPRNVLEWVWVWVWVLERVWECVWVWVLSYANLS